MITHTTLARPCLAVRPGGDILTVVGVGDVRRVCWCFGLTVFEGVYLASLMCYYNLSVLALALVLALVRNRPVYLHIDALSRC